MKAVLLASDRDRKRASHIPFQHLANAFNPCRDDESEAIALVTQPYSCQTSQPTVEAKAEGICLLSNK